MSFNFGPILEVLSPYIFSLLDKGLAKLFNSTQVDEVTKDYVGKLKEAIDIVIEKTRAAIEIAEDNRNPITDGVVFKLGRVLKGIVLKVQPLINYIETNFGAIELDPDKVRK